MRAPRFITPNRNCATLTSQEIYEAALQRSRSPVVALFDQIEVGKSPFKKAMKKI